MTTATATSRPKINTPPRRDPQTDAADRPAADLPHDASFFAIAKEAVNEWLEDKVMKMSASLAFFSMLALAPLIVISLKVLSVFLGAKAASGQLQHQVGAMAGEQVAQGIQTTMQAANKPGSGIVATVLSVLIALWGAASLFGELQDSFNTIWEVKPKPNLGVMAWIKNRFFSMTMVMGVAFMLLVSMVVSTIITGISGWFIGHLFGTGGTASKVIAFLIDFVVSTGLITVLFATMFKYLPDVKIGWRDVWVGGFVTSVLFQIGKYVLGIYLGKAAPGSAYGAAGSLVALLIWVYYSGFILYFGAEFTQVYARKGGRIVEPTDNAVQMSDEDRMETGVPHREAVDQAVAEQSGEGGSGRRGGAGRRPG
jgi:membrane protein